MGSLLISSGGVVKRNDPMKNVNRKWWVALVAFLCLVPSTLVAKSRDDKKCGDDGRRCQPVPEGGSGLIYLLGAGITCAGAIVIHSRENKLNRT